MCDWGTLSPAGVTHPPHEFGGGTYWRTKRKANGFPRGYCMPAKSVRGFQTGDMVRADVPKGKKAGIHVGRLAIRARGSFNVGSVTDINWKHVRLLLRSDGYGYAVSALPVNPLNRITPRPKGLKAGIPCWSFDGRHRSGGGER